MLLKKLDWDTNFFGFGVGECCLKGDEVLRLPDFCKSGLKLIYIKAPGSVLKSQLEAIGAILVDKKTVYSKTLDSNRLDSKDASGFEYRSYRKGEDIGGLDELALDSGLYSRFNSDPNISQEKFQSLYRTWIRKSIMRELADDVIVARSEGSNIGMVTVSLNSGVARIGLIAVNSGFRGCNVGKNLIVSAELWGFNSGGAKMSVATQGDNLPACNFYEKCGYSVSELTYIYHLWLS